MLYCAADLSPLPYESSFGGLMRLSARNVFRPQYLEDVLLFGLPRSARLLSSALQNKPTLARDLDWTLPLDEEIKFFAKESHHSLFVSEELRYCRSCLTAGYHSYLYQIRAVGTCPIHAELLADRCNYCGHKPSRLRGYFAQPYHCEKCKLRLCQADSLVLSQHLQFRENFSKAAPRLATIYDWYIVTEAARARSQKMISRPNRINQRLVESHFALTAAHGGTTSLPAHGIDDVVVLRWRYDATPRIGGFRDGAAPPALGWRTLLARSAPAFQVATRIILRWIDDLRGSKAEESKTLAAEDALQRLRTQWHDRSVPNLRYFCAVPLVPEKFYAFALHRRAWLYGAFATFSNLYISALEGDINSVAEVPCHLMTTDAICEGEVILPYIPGLSELIARKCKNALILKRG